VVISIEGERKYLAHVGQFKGKRALRVARAITAKDSVL
jgi:flagellar motor switch protein FliM